MVLCKKSKIISFASSIAKNVSVFSSRSTFPVTLICYIAFGSPSSTCCLGKSIAISL